MRLIVTIKKKKFNKTKDKAIFFGSWDEERESIIEKIQPDLIEIYGNSWKKAKLSFRKTYKVFDFELTGVDLVKNIKKYLCCINLNRPQVQNAHNMRSFEVLGYGGILINKSTLESRKLFKSKINCFFYNEHPEINNLINYILKNKKNILKKRDKNQLIYNKQNYLSRSKKIIYEIS